MSEDWCITELQKVFLENGEIHIDGEINAEMAAYVHECLLHLRANGSPDIVVFIRSPGGTDPDGFQIYDELRHYAGNTIGIVNGFAHSMAAIVLQGCMERRAYHHAMFLIHEASLVGSVTRSMLSPKAAAKLSAKIRKSTVKSRKIFEFHTDLTSKELKTLMALEKILTATEALTLGFIDELC